MANLQQAARVGNVGVEELVNMLRREAGEQPVTRVLRDLKHLPSGKIYHIIAPFVPAPLIDQASRMNYTHFIRKEKENLVHVYFILQNG